MTKIRLSFTDSVERQDLGAERHHYNGQGDDCHPIGCYDFVLWVFLVICLVDYVF